MRVEDKLRNQAGDEIDGQTEADTAARMIGAVGAKPTQTIGVGIGTVRRDEPLLVEPKRNKSDSDEVFDARVKRFERFKHVKIDVRRGDRNVVRNAQLAMEVLEAEINEIEAPSQEKCKASDLIGYAEAVDKKIAKLNVELRKLLEMRVIHPRTEKDLGATLVGVHGLPYEDSEIGVVDLAAMPMLYVIDAITDLNMLDLFAAAVLRLQEPTRAQKN